MQEPLREHVQVMLTREELAKLVAGKIVQKNAIDSQHRLAIMVHS